MFFYVINAKNHKILIVHKDYNHLNVLLLKYKTQLQTE